jgi:predicted RNA binding protein YcfA (HicA-like mRNA interferase family)
VKVGEVIKAIEADGWRQVRQRGSHRHFQHLTKSGTVTVPGHLGDEMALKTLSSIWKQAKMKGVRP